MGSVHPPAAGTRTRKMTFFNLGILVSSTKLASGVLRLELESRLRVDALDAQIVDFIVARVHLGKEAFHIGHRIAILLLHPVLRRETHRDDAASYVGEVQIEAMERQADVRQSILAAVLGDGKGTKFRSSSRGASCALGSSRSSGTTACPMPRRCCPAGQQPVASEQRMRKPIAFCMVSRRQSSALLRQTRSRTAEGAPRRDARIRGAQRKKALNA